MKIWFGKHDFRGLFEDNIQNLPRLREIWINYNLELLPLSDRGGTVIKVLCYKSGGRWFVLSWRHWNFSFKLNPSNRTMALGSTELLTEMSIRSIS